VTSQCEAVEFSEEKIRSVLKQFTGTIDQQPPVFSALKHNGVPLYKLARSGHPVQKAARSVQIASIEVCAIALPEIRFVVACSAGTYVRTLGADIGAVLGCGGHLQALRRIESGGFSIREAISLPALEAVVASGSVQEHIIDMAGALRNMPEFVADSVLIDKIRFGKPLTDVDIDPDRIDFSGDFIKVLDPENRLLAIVSLNKKDRTYKYNCVFHS
jgi:tRNA pseudouridine55 synthase